jgi:hypothetical protein
MFGFNLKLVIIIVLLNDLDYVLIYFTGILDIILWRTSTSAASTEVETKTAVEVKT